MKIVFMGTPDFAVGALQALIDAGHEITAVVTQPDKPKGRGKEMQFTPVKECAIMHGIPVFQPVKIKTPEAVETLRSYESDVFIVAAFGQILSKEILEMPKYGCLNIHASLLPKYRGAAPIQWVIIDGERETGVTIMQMNEGLDTGDMLLKKSLVMDEKETGESLHDKLMQLGAEAITEALPLLETGQLIPQKQDDSQSCYAKMLKKSLGHIEWNKSAAELERLIRGLNSWPSAYTFFRRKQLKIWEADVVTDTEEKLLKEKGQEEEPGTIVCVEKDAIYVITGNGILKILSLQLEGKKRMQVHDFLLGYQIQKGEILGK